MSQLNFNVAGDPKNDQVALVSDNPPGGTFLVGHFEGVSGQLPNRYIAEIPGSITGGATLYYQNRTKQFRVIVPPGEGQWEAGLAPCLPPEYNGNPERVVIRYSNVGTIGHQSGKLGPSGRILLNDGIPHILCGTSSFRLHEYLCGDYNIIPVIEESIKLGLEDFRVFGIMHFIPLSSSDPDFAPSVYNNYWQKLDTLCDIISNRKCRLTYTFGDCQVLLPTDNQQRRYFDQLKEVLGGRDYVSIEGGNELPKNGITPGTLTKPAQNLAAQGSNIGDGWAIEPTWDIVFTHPTRSDEWYRNQIAREQQDALNKPCWLDEPMGAAEIKESGRRDNIPLHFYYLGALGSFTGGVRFHSQSGLHSELLGPIQTECAIATVEGLNAFPKEVQYGKYTAGHLSDCPLSYDEGLALRIICRIVDNKSFAVVIWNEDRNYNPIIKDIKAKNGWVITKQFGRNGSLVELSR